MNSEVVQTTEQTLGTDKNFALGRKRFQRPFPQPPLITLNAEGTITDMSPTAVRLLEHRDQKDVNRSFFSYVHGKNLYQVMRDVADMVCYGKPRAAWLLRLKTGQGRWRWYKVVATSRLSEPRPIIEMTIRDVNE